MRSLTEAEWHAYDHIPPAVAARVRILRVPVLAPGADGMTLGRFVLLRRDEPDQRTGERELLAHELVHTVQYAELGMPRFLWRYVVAYLRNRRRLGRHRDAYLAIPFEEEARAAAARWAEHRRR
ncbi:MAG: eCIS core domain-containing protein [Acidimicrobiales bacterium]